jgi:hypothetical protein
MPTKRTKMVGRCCRGLLGGGTRSSSSCCKVDADSKGNHGQTPLLVAAENGKEALVKLLAPDGIRRGEVHLREEKA